MTAVVYQPSQLLFAQKRRLALQAALPAQQGQGIAAMTGVQCARMKTWFCYKNMSCQRMLHVRWSHFCL